MAGVHKMVSSRSNSGGSVWYDAALLPAALTRMQRHLFRKDTNWFAVGYACAPQTNGYNTWEREFQGDNQSNPPRLIVDYTPPSIPHDVGVVRILQPIGLVDSFPSMTPRCSVARPG